MPVEWRVSNQMFSIMNDIRYVIFRRIKQVWPSPIGKKFTKDPPLRRPPPPLPNKKNIPSLGVCLQGPEVLTLLEDETNKNLQNETPKKTPTKNLKVTHTLREQKAFS